ncbi:MAG: NAD-dependent epimerase/dehydratase family protein [Lachnospiraceae bacterium]|nr:NAD-dependent epimerase/dehydratase family protein [Candidatus Colinaster equi]
MSKVLITGINGFIGKHIADYLCKCENEIIGIDVSAGNGTYNTIVCDMAKDDLTDILESARPDIVIHCAGIANVSYSIAHPDDDFEANTAVVHRLLYAMLRAGLTSSRVLFLSSAGVYGQPEILPISENTQTSPISPYALHKRMAEDICSYFVDVHGMDIRIARIFSAYGPGLRKQLFWDMYQKVLADGNLQLFGTGEETRDFIYIDDLVRALGLILEAKKSTEYIYNVANGKQVSIREVAGCFAKQMSDKIEVSFNNQNRKGDPDNWCADISKLHGLGYKQQVSLDEGIAQYIEWVRNN